MMDDLIKRANDAIQGVTPGPWDVRGKQTVGIGVETVAKCGWRNGKNDARFIAAARDLVPEMAAEIMILRHELAAMSAKMAGSV